MKKIVVVLVFLFIPGFTYAGISDTLDSIEGKGQAKVATEVPTAKEGGLRKIGIFTGFLDERMKHEHDNRGVSLLVSLGYDARPFFSKVGISTKGYLDFVLEPFFNVITSPSDEFEVGSNFLVEYDFPLTDWFQPYIKGGLGLIYMSQETKEQGTQWNFLPQGSVGFHWSLKDNIAFSCEYRHRHLSNASIKHPNKGIDAKMYLAGITFFFE
ncbi:MAG: acyloxyacyl hydrolase [Candidatus Omnitrophica bacterium]|nr:acyloxyacyl hydrolase [Candidatus Omnitrophota bacterium]